MNTIYSFLLYLVRDRISLGKIASLMLLLSFFLQMYVPYAQASHVANNALTPSNFSINDVADLSVVIQVPTSTSGGQRTLYDGSTRFVTGSDGSIPVAGTLTKIRYRTNTDEVRFTFSGNLPSQDNKVLYLSKDPHTVHAVGLDNANEAGNNLWVDLTNHRSARTLMEEVIGNSPPSRLFLAIGPILDTTAPTLSGASSIGTTNDSTPDFSFTSNEDGTLSVSGSCSTSTSVSVSANTQKTITLNTLSDGVYSDCAVVVTDSADNASSALPIPAFTIDTTKPVITITGNASVSITSGDAYTDLGATVVDPGNSAYTGTVTTRIRGPLGHTSFDNTIVGDWVYTYSAPADSAGNTPISVTRTVTVVALPVSYSLSDFPSIDDEIIRMLVRFTSSGGNDVFIYNSTTNPVTGELLGSSDSRISSYGVISKIRYRKDRRSLILNRSGSENLNTWATSGDGQGKNLYIASTPTDIKTLPLSDAAKGGGFLTFNLSADDPIEQFLRSVVESTTEQDLFFSIGDPLVLVTDTTAPTLSNPSSIGTTNDNTPDLSFTSDEAGDITLSGGCSSSTTTATVGVNTITFNTLIDGTYSCTITVTDVNNNASEALTIPQFIVNTVVLTALDDSLTIEKNIVTEIDVLGNDLGFDGGTLSIATQPSNGVALLSSGNTKITYTPTTDYVGTDSFTYSITIGTTVVTATVSITLVPGSYREDVSVKWPIRTYIINTNLNSWINLDLTQTYGASDGSLPIADRLQDPDDADAAPSFGRCADLVNNPSEAERHQVFYYHLSDSDDASFDIELGADGDRTTAPTVADKARIGKIEGRGCSPLFGLVLFSQDDALGGYPSSGSCFGLTGKNRQPRVVKDGSDYELRGCVYVPFFDEYILLGKNDATADSDWDDWDDWKGVTVDIVDDVLGAGLALQLKGCGYSNNGGVAGGLESGLWAFSNEINSGDTICLNEKASLVTTIDNWLKKYCTNSSCDGGNTDDYGEKTTGVAEITPESPVAALTAVSDPTTRIGRRVEFRIRCPVGHRLSTFKLVVGEDGAGKEINIDLSEIISGDTIGSTRNEYIHRRVVVQSIRTTRATCVDPREFFTQDKTQEGGTTSVSGSVNINNFVATPSVLVEGGFVSFVGTIENTGPPLANDPAHCKITQKKVGDTTEHELTNDDGDVWFSIAGLAPHKLADISITDVVVQDVFYELECEYCTSDGIHNTDVSIASDCQETENSPFNNAISAGPWTTSVRVLPSALFERNIDDKSCIPEATRSGNTITISPDDSNCLELIETLRVYAIDSETDGLDVDSSIHKEFGKSFSDATSITDRDQKYPETTDTPSSPQVRVSDVEDKVLILEYYFTNGDRSRKIIFPSNGKPLD